MWQFQLFVYTLLQMQYRSYIRMNLSVSVPHGAMS